jgi:23S rRNA (cytidine1920-2'-O)/16S rRNA (cytidine1409-2'-O)-methyltransferase
VPAKSWGKAATGSVEGVVEKGLGVKKVRADVLLVERGLAPSRAKAQALILAGSVYAGDDRVDKAGTPFAAEAVLSVRQAERYVSRGGHKLEGALQDLGVSFDGRVVLDVGSSTGGFTDCALQHGAVRVYAVDVGQGLLADKLRRDPRVVVMERTNARQLRSEMFDAAPDLALVDASFIGMGKLLPALALVLPQGAALLAMIKPQFEVGKEAARRHQGVIRDPKLRQSAIAAVTAEISSAGFLVVGAADCRVPGPKGNVEHFVHARREIGAPMGAKPIDTSTQ